MIYVEVYTQNMALQIYVGISGCCKRANVGRQDVLITSPLFSEVGTHIIEGLVLVQIRCCLFVWVMRSAGGARYPAFLSLCTWLP